MVEVKGKGGRRPIFYGVPGEKFRIAEIELDDTLPWA